MTKSEDTQQWNTEDIKQAGVSKYSSPRQSKPTTQTQQKDTAVQITGMIVVLLFALAIIAAVVILLLSLVK